MLPDLSGMTGELARNLLSFGPELLVCFTIVLLLFLRLFG